MKKLLILPLLPLLFFLLPQTASASTQILMGGSILADSTGNAYFVPNTFINPGLSNILSTSSVAISPVAGTLSNLYAYKATAGHGYQAILAVNGVNTPMACNMYAAVMSCNDTTHTVTIKPGDSFSVLITGGGGGGNSQISFSIAFTPTTPNQTMINGNGGVYGTVVPNTAISNAGWDKNATFATGGNLVANYFADSGTLSNLYIAATSSLTTGSYEFNAYAGPNMSTSTLDCSLTTSANYCADTSDATTTVAGVTLSSLHAVPFAPSTRGAAYAAMFVPNTAGNFDLFSGGSSITTAEYESIVSSYVNATEAPTSLQAQPMVVTALYVWANTTTGGSGTRTVTLNDNGVATALTCMMNNTSSCSITGQSVTVNQGDLLDYAMTQTGSPTNQYVNASLSAYALPEVPPAPAPKQILYGRVSNQSALTGNSYFAPNGFYTSNQTLAGTSTADIAPINGTFSTFYAYSDYPTTGNIVYTLYVNGNPTSLSCVIATGYKSCSDTTDTVSISAGSSFTVYVNPLTGNVSNPTYSIGFTPTTANETMIMGNSGTVVNGASTEYMPFRPVGGFATVPYDIVNVWADAGTIDHFYAAATSSLSTGQYALSLAAGYSPNGSAYASPVTCILGTSANYCADLTHATSTIPGYWSTASSTPTAPDLHVLTYGARFVPTTAGNFEISSPQPFTTAGGYLPIIGQSNSFTVEASSSIYAQPMVITAMYVKTQSNTNYTYTLDDNGVATALTCTPNGTRICNVTGQSVTVNQGDRLDYNITSSGASPNDTTVTLSAHVPTSVRQSYPKTPAKNGFWGGLVRILGGFLRIK